jgi:hypothetical protein
MVPDTAWNQTTDKQIFLISPQLWSYEKSVTTATFDDRFRMLGDDSGPDVGKLFTMHPTPSATETIYYQYYSTHWVADSGGTQKASFSSDSDTVAFDDELFTMGVIWRTLKSIGQMYDEEKADGNITTFSNIPETGYG